MIVAGLTGSIGMGKSTVAGHISARGFPVIDADQIVRTLYSGEAVPLIETAFPGTTRDGCVDRETLSRRIIASPSEIRKLEAIVHPLVRAAEWAFLKAAKAQGSKLAVMEVPLLFETAQQDLFDAVIVASTSGATQRERLLGRPGMTSEKLEAIIARQLPDAEKRQRADYVVDTGLSMEDTFTQIDAILEDISKRTPRAYARWAALYTAP